MEDVERTIDGLQEEIEAAEEDANEEREMSKKIKRGMARAGFDPTDMIEMGRAAQAMTEPTLIGAVVEMRIRGVTYRGEVVKYDPTGATTNIPWLVKFGDGGQEHTKRAKLTIIHQSLLGRKINKEFDGEMYDGEVIEYDYAGATKDTPWLILFEDGDCEHMEREEVEGYLKDRSDIPGLQGCDAAKKIL